MNCAGVSLHAHRQAHANNLYGALSHHLLHLLHHAGLHEKPPWKIGYCWRKLARRDWCGSKTPALTTAAFASRAAARPSLVASIALAALPMPPTALREARNLLRPMRPVTN